MVIETLELTNFRNFPLRKFVFTAKNIIFRGTNGVGKSNILESIAFLSLLRSFRGASPREMIRLGSDGFVLRGRIASSGISHELKVSADRNGRRELILDSEPVHRSSDFIREFFAVSFVPEDLQIAAGGAAERRRFLDILISSVDPEYLMRLSRYRRALQQRNAALRTNPALAGAFESELGEQVPYIVGKRAEFSRLLTDEMRRLLGDRGSFDLAYRTDVPDNPADFVELLHRKRDYELRQQCTAAGPQRDEFNFFFNDKLLRLYGSTGQLRLLTLLLKLAQLNLISAKSTLPIVVLVDDVTGELDEANLQLFLRTISGAGQCFFTFAREQPFVLPEFQQIMLGDEK